MILIILPCLPSLLIILTVRLLCLPSGVVSGWTGTTCTTRVSLDSSRPSGAVVRVVQSVVVDVEPGGNVSSVASSV